VGRLLLQCGRFITVPQELDQCTREGRVLGNSDAADRLSLMGLDIGNPCKRSGPDFVEHMVCLKRRHKVGLRDDRTAQGDVFDFQRDVQDHVKSCEVLIDPCAERGIAPSQDPLGGAKILWAGVRLLGKRIVRTAVELGLLVIDGFLDQPGAILVRDQRSRTISILAAFKRSIISWNLTAQSVGRLPILALGCLLR
jgi:hypothetical protein